MQAVTDNPVILITGNAVSGLDFIGPFEDAEAAAAYAEFDREIRDMQWTVGPMFAPAEGE